MSREDLDKLSQDLLGRPLTAVECRDLLHTMIALQLGPGSPLAVLVILYQALRSEVSQAMEVASAHHRWICSRTRLLSFAARLALAVGCGVLGYPSHPGKVPRTCDRTSEASIRGCAGHRGTRTQKSGGSARAAR
jgi:hypothetical protein